MKRRFTNPLPMPRDAKFGNNYILFYSVKRHERVTAFSNLEYENLLTLEMDPEVEYYCPQPVRAVVDDVSIKGETVFDAYVVYRNGREEMQETKYLKDLESADDPGSRIYYQLRKQKEWCALHDIDYKVVSEEEIEKGQYTIRNLQNLASRVRRFEGVLDPYKRLLLDFLSQNEDVTIGEIIQTGILPKGAEVDLIAMFCFLGIVRLDNIDKRVITDQTEVLPYER